MRKFKKVKWCWTSGDHVLSVKGMGSSIRDAYQKLSKNDKARAIENVKWIEFDGAVL